MLTVIKKAKYSVRYPQSHRFVTADDRGQGGRDHARAEVRWPKWFRDRVRITLDHWNDDDPLTSENPVSEPEWDKHLQLAALGVLRQRLGDDFWYKLTGNEDSRCSTVPQREPKLLLRPEDM